MTYKNLSDIVDAYQKDGAPYFAVKSGKSILERHETSDTEEGAEKLEEFLKKAGGSKLTVFTFKSIPKTGITEKSEPYKIFPYQAEYTPEQKEDYYQRSGIAGAIIAEVRDVKRELAEVRAKMDAEEEDDDELEEKMEPAPGGIVGALLGNPAVQTMLSNLLANVTANMVTRPAPVSRPVHLSGVEVDDVAASCLEVLMAKGMTIEDLKKLADMAPDRIAFLLNILRNG